MPATILMGVEDCYQNGKRWWSRLHEEGGTQHQVPVAPTRAQPNSTTVVAGKISLDEVERISVQELDEIDKIAY